MNTAELKTKLKEVFEKAKASSIKAYESASKFIVAAYQDTKKFVITTYQDVKNDKKKSIIAIAIAGTLSVGLLSILLSGGSSESPKVVIVDHGEHRYTQSDVEQEPSENVYSTMRGSSTENDVPEMQSPLGNGDTLDGDGVQTQFMKYTVDSKESLYSIAKKIYGSSHYWVLIYERNKQLIKDPDLIFAGQELEVPFRSDGNLSWDKERIVENYIEVYKTYRKHEKLSEVYWLLYTGVKRIDPALLDHYKTEVKKFDRAFARGELNGIPPESDNT